MLNAMIALITPWHRVGLFSDQSVHASRPSDLETVSQLKPEDMEVTSSEICSTEHDDDNGQQPGIVINQC